MMHRNIIKLKDTQNELEDALCLEIGMDEVKNTKYGNQLLKYLRKRRRTVNGIIKKSEKEML